jgi:hypothetical protein
MSVSDEQVQAALTAYHRSGVERFDPGHWEARYMRAALVAAEIVESDELARVRLERDEAWRELLRVGRSRQDLEDMIELADDVRASALMSLSALEAAEQAAPVVPSVNAASRCPRQGTGGEPTGVRHDLD